MLHTTKEILSETTIKKLIITEIDNSFVGNDENEGNTIGYDEKTFDSDVKCEIAEITTTYSDHNRVDDVALEISIDGNLYKRYEPEKISSNIHDDGVGYIFTEDILSEDDGQTTHLIVCTLNHYSW